MICVCIGTASKRHFCISHASVTAQVKLGRKFISIVAEGGIVHKRDAILSLHQGTLHCNATYSLQYLYVVNLSYANIDKRLCIDGIKPEAKQVLTQ
jgi:hypothetical protein